MKNKIVSAAEAIAIMRDGDTVACSGFVGSGTPEELIVAIEQRFVETGGPRDLTLVFAAAPGDGKERGLNRLAHAGLVKRVIGGHWALVPKLSALAIDDQIEAYNLPLGTLTQLFRDIAAHRAGIVTKVGLRTFVDPRQGSTQPAELWVRLGKTLLEVGAFVALMLVVGRRVFPWLLWQVTRTGSRELFTLCVVAAAVSIAYGSAKLFGVSFALGAFFAGMVLRESHSATARPRKRCRCATRSRCCSSCRSACCSTRPCSSSIPCRWLPS